MDKLQEKSRTLVLVNHPGWQNRQDFEEIKAKIEEIAPDIDVRIVDADRPADGIDACAWQRPCLVISFATPIGFRPERGVIYCCRPIPKFEQLQKLNRAGIPVPLSARLEFGKHLDGKFWGPLVVLKPTTPGFMSQGAVYLIRTQRVADLAETVFPPGHPSRQMPVIVQRFIDTGEQPSYYRVLTLFGEPLYCIRGMTDEKRPPLDSPDDVLLKAQVATNAEFVGRNSRFACDADVLDLARRAYGAMPAIPLQGVDIIREQETGRLFVLEINPGGNTWHFSSGHMDHRNAGRVPTIPRAARIAQFCAWEVAARALIKKTLEEAR
jgi:hypothetical protein